MQLFSRIKSFHRFTQFVCEFSRNSIANWENELHNSMQQFVLLPLKKSLCHFRVFNLYIFFYLFNGIHVVKEKVKILYRLHVSCKKCYFVQTFNNYCFLHHVYFILIVSWLEYCQYVVKHKTGIWWIFYLKSAFRYIYILQIQNRTSDVNCLKGLYYCIPVRSLYRKMKTRDFVSSVLLS